MEHRVSIRPRWPFHAGRTRQRKRSRWRAAARRVSRAGGYGRKDNGTGKTGEVSRAIAVARKPRLNVTSYSSKGRWRWWKTPIASIRSQSTGQQNREQATILARGYKRWASSIEWKSLSSTRQKTARTSPWPGSGNRASLTRTSQSKFRARAATSTCCQSKFPASSSTGRQFALHFRAGGVPFMVRGNKCNSAAKQKELRMDGKASVNDNLASGKSYSCRGD